MKKLDIRIRLSSRDFNAPRFLTEGFKLEARKCPQIAGFTGFDVYYHKGSYYAVENGVHGYKQLNTSMERAEPLVYAIVPETGRVSRGDAGHWDRQTLKTDNEWFHKGRPDKKGVKSLREAMEFITTNRESYKPDFQRQTCGGPVRDSYEIGVK